MQNNVSNARVRADEIVRQLSANPAYAQQLTADVTALSEPAAICGISCSWTCSWTSFAA